MKKIIEEFEDLGAKKDWLFLVGVIIFILLVFCVPVFAGATIISEKGATVLIDNNIFNYNKSAITCLENKMILPIKNTCFMTINKTGKFNFMVKTSRILAKDILKDNNTIIEELDNLATEEINKRADVGTLITTPTPSTNNLLRKDLIKTIATKKSADKTPQDCAFELNIFGITWCVWK